MNDKVVTYSSGRFYFQSFIGNFENNDLKNPVNPVKSKRMEYEDITHQIIGSAYQVFNELGFGFLESVYKKALVIELKKNGSINIFKVFLTVSVKSIV